MTFNEACSGDAARIARRAGFHLSFSRVVYRGTPLRCTSPRGRGFFGDAVLTKAAIEGSEGRAFGAQTGIEQRGWLCVTTRRAVDVCTAHLSTLRNATAEATNDAQCTELRDLLARRAGTHPIAFGGDLNRRGSCAPEGLWTRTDSSGGQAPGLQQVTEAASASAGRRRGCCPPNTVTTTCCWSARGWSCADRALRPRGKQAERPWSTWRGCACVYAGDGGVFLKAGGFDGFQTRRSSRLA